MKVKVVMTRHTQKLEREVKMKVLESGRAKVDGAESKVKVADQK